MSKKNKLQAFKNFFQERDGLREIIELTYAYEDLGNNKWYNNTLFDKFANCSEAGLSKSMGSGEGHRKQAEKSIDQVIKQLNEFKENFLQGSEIEKIVAHYCDYGIDMLTMARYGLPFELQKAGASLELSQEQFDIHLRNVVAIDKKLFGKRLKDDVFESTRVVNELEKIFKEGNQNLNSEEQESFEDTISFLKENSSYNKNFVRENNFEFLLDVHPFFDQEIPREVYIAIFKNVFAIYGIDKEVVVDNRSSIYDGLQALHIPKSEDYDTLRLQKVLELAQHEIEVHYLIQHNTNLLLPINDGANSLFKEEGLAKFLEEVVNGATIDEIDISPGMVQILPGELLSGKEYKEFFKLLWKLKGDDKKGPGYLLRRKRNYPFDGLGIQHKGVTYSRGRFQIRSYLLNGNSFKSLYYAKVSFDDIALLERVVTKEIEEKMLFPQFIAERLLWNFLYNIGTNKQAVNNDPQQQERHFLDYLYKKYPFIDFDDLPPINLNKQQQHYVEEMVDNIRHVLSTKIYQPLGDEE